MTSKKAPSRRQLTFGVCIVGLDLEPLLRGETVGAIGTVLTRPQAESSADDIPLDVWADYVPPPFVWPKVGAPLVHYPLGALGPRVEHGPGIVCEFCQWQTDNTGFPVGAFGREPQRFCEGCRTLVPRRSWQASAGVCRGCNAAQSKRAGSCPGS